VGSEICIFGGCEKRVSPAIRIFRIAGIGSEHLTINLKKSVHYSLVKSLTCLKTVSISYKLIGQSYGVQNEKSRHSIH